jgi:archaetidylinositol phosphate synthase
MHPVPYGTEMNITALRPNFIARLEPIADLFIKLGVTPNQISLLSLICGIGCAAFYFRQAFVAGSILLFISAILDLVDGSVARKIRKESDFGAVIDWIIDKYVDSFALFAIGASGIRTISNLIPFSPSITPVADFSIVALAIIGSMMNTFIKPVVYAEVGFHTRLDGKIDDPLEGIGFFGRPETVLVLILGGFTGFIWVSVLIIAVCTNLSAIQRIFYLYRRLA